tara:strand:+ start:5660 stop:6121 length:462 start_codon:yes stop_codon:yes gene_type:complete
MNQNKDSIPNKLVNEPVEGDISEFKPRYFTSTLLPTEVPNKNGVVWSREAISKAVEDYEKKVKDGRALCEMGENATEPFVNLDRVSHVVEEISYDGEKATCSIRTIDTPMGNILNTLLDKKLVKFSARGTGVTSDGVVKSFSIVDIGFHPKNG